jgi:hypothetical protein
MFKSPSLFNLTRDNNMNQIKNLKKKEFEKPEMGQITRAYTYISTTMLY